MSEQREEQMSLDAAKPAAANEHIVMGPCICAKETIEDPKVFSLEQVVEPFLMDPHAVLPLNSDRLLAETCILEKLIADTNMLAQGEIDQIQRFQKKIALWEEKIEKNRALIEKNRAYLQKNAMDIVYDRKSRDHWEGLAELVLMDYRHAQAANLIETWEWLIKKWGLKNADGTSISGADSFVEELTLAKCNRLAEDYRIAANRYEQAKKEKEAEGYRLIRENSKLLQTNEILQGFIKTTYQEEVEPCQDGILLLKELTLKLKVLEKKGDQATYVDLRSWADKFLDDFLKTNPGVSLSVVTEFRKLASIPLPGENC